MAQSAEMLTKFMKRSQVRRNKKPGRIKTSYPSLKPTKGRSDASTPLYRSVSSEPPSGTMQGTYKARERYYLGHHPTSDGNVPRFYSDTPRQQAPYKPGQAARSRKLRRSTRPTPGSAYRNKRQTN